MDTPFVTTTNIVDHQVGSTPEPTGTCSNDDRICTRFILNALQTLCVSPSVCLSVNDDGYSARPGTSALNAQTRRIDDALRTNRRVIGLVSRILQCPCSAIPSVQLLLVIACDRIVAWYRAMLRDDGSVMMHDQIPFSSSSNIEYDRCELVLAMPVTVGDFTVDTSMQMRIRDQLVIEEMRSVEIVIHQFAARLREAQCHISQAHRQQIHVILNSMLRDQLQDQANIIQERMNSW